MQVEYQVLVAEKRGEPDYADVLRDMVSDQIPEEQPQDSTIDYDDAIVKLSYFLASASLAIQNIQNQLRA